MGFSIVEPIEIARFGIGNLANCYVTIKGSCYITKNSAFNQGQDPDKPYCLSTTYYIYTSSNATEPLNYDRVSLYYSNYPAEDTSALIYAHLKTLFPDKTFVDN